MPLSESEIQKAVFEQLNQRGAFGVVFWHTPNDKASRRKAGYRAGVSDVIVMRSGETFLLELKVENAKTPPQEQLDFQADIRAAGGHAMIAYGLDEAITILEQWQLLRGRRA